ncbi:MAG: hypothetical protein WDO13_19170 [Verrucomicrobiota bacterium]
MALLDLLIVALPLVTVLAVSLYARRYLKSVGRLYGRRATRRALPALDGAQRDGRGRDRLRGDVRVVLPTAASRWVWWKQLAAMVTLVIAISGFVVYRYRQTRALTLAQFFEMRYSRRFRLFTGFLAFLAGLLNFGVIPVVGAKFIVYFLDLPQQLALGGAHVPTYLVLMAVFLSITTLIAITGGQITIMMADCIQGMFSQIFYVIIGVALIVTLNWPADARDAAVAPGGPVVRQPVRLLRREGLQPLVRAHRHLGHGLLHHGVAEQLRLQRRGRVGARIAHGLHPRLVARLRAQHRDVHPRRRVDDLPAPAPPATPSWRSASPAIADPQTAEQMELPIGLAQILPVGIKGLFISIVLMGVFGGDGQHLHSWGSILVQDVILPLRGKPISTRAHIILLRAAILGVALFAYVFGALFTQTEYLPMWFNITTAIYVGGAGSCIIGGLYWSRATAEGAWAGLLTGSLLSIGGILIRQPAAATLFDAFCARTHLGSAAWAQLVSTHLGPGFPLNGTVISFYASLIAVAVFAVVSLLTCRQPHDMDRLLHRGKYAIEPEATGETVHPRAARHRFHLYNLVGIDEHFSRADRWVTLGIFYWSLFWFLVFVVGSVAYLVHPWPAGGWASYWLVTNIYLPLVISIGTTIWFTIGCWHDLVLFFRRLGTERVDPRDDGTVEPGDPPAP